MQNDQLEPLFSIPQVGRILGFEKSTVYDRIKNGRLGAVRLDGAIRVPRSELVKYIAAATPVSA